jgi:hypothetical protein
MAKVSAAVVISGLPGLELLLLPLLLSDSCRFLLAGSTKLSPSLGLELSGSDGGKSITKSGVCLGLCGCEVAVVVGTTGTAAGVDVMDVLFSQRSRRRTNEPLAGANADP